VANKVARLSPTPVLVVASPHLQPVLEKIMVCLDGSELAEMALARAALLARAVGAKLLLYRFVPMPYPTGEQSDEQESAEEYLAEVRLGYPDLVVDTLVRPTDGSSLIMATAAEYDIDLIVVGSEGIQGFARWLLGSVAEDALAHARCPLMVVHRDPRQSA
jgi:nucleotide-binding universal stress UspA family protein